LTLHQKTAVDPRLLRLLRSSARGKKAGRGAFLAPLRRAKKKTTKQAAEVSYIRSKEREEVLPLSASHPKESEKKASEIDWDSLVAAEVASSDLISCLTKLGNKTGSRVGLYTCKSKIEGGKSHMDHATSKLAQGILHEKIASEMLRLDSAVRGHRKRAHATKLLFKQAELGMTQLPQTFSEFEEKLAAMEREDLTVLERALELTGGNVKLGELCDPDSQDLSASEKFQALILGELDP
jgi:hypothetical protein